jgi:hypothetical protein
MELTVISGKLTKKQKVKLSERPGRDSTVIYTSGKAPKARPELRSNSYLWEGLDLRFGDGGAVVERVSADSKLFGYLRRGDIIKAVNRTAVTSFAGMPDVFKAANLAEGALFDIERDGDGMFISVQCHS